MTNVASNEQERARERRDSRKRDKRYTMTMKDVIVDGNGYRGGDVFRERFVEGRRKVSRRDPRPG